MHFLNRISMRNTLVIAMLSAVLISTCIVGFVGHTKAKELLVSRLQQSDLPNLLQRVRNAVDGDILQMKVLTTSIAQNPFLLRWLDKGAPSEDAATVVSMLKNIAQDNGLSNVSFADRSTAKYWNQDGFLRALKRDAADGWFFKFKDSGNTELVSTYIYPDGNVDVFVNYQDLNGNGLSGVSKSFNEMVDYLNSFQIEKSGFVYLVDPSGMVKIHHDKALTEKSNLSMLYPKINAQQLLNAKNFAFQETDTLIIASSYIPSLDWYVIAEVPKSELYAGLNESRNFMIMWVIIVLILFSLLSFVMANRLTKPINNLGTLFETLGQGDADLSYRLEETGNVELVRLARGFNDFINNINEVVKDVSLTSTEVHKGAIEVSDGADKSKLDAQEQRDLTTQVATAISELGSTITEIASNATHAADATNEASAQAKNAQLVVQESTLSIDKMATKMEDVSTIISSLAEKSNAIGSVLEVIRGISEQTNLLALNAAIEAARAGEQGRGFAVVADEVRNLAQRTNQSTDEINQMIQSLQADSMLAVDGVSESKEISAIGVDAAKRTSEALGEIVENIQALSDLNTQVATATEEQSVVISEINVHVHAINDNTENGALTADNMADSSTQLSRLAEKLDKLVARFKI